MLFEKLLIPCAFAVTTFTMLPGAIACTINSGPLYSYEFLGLVPYQDNTLPANARVLHARINRPQPDALPLEVRQDPRALPEPLMLEEVSTRAHDTGNLRLVTSHWSPVEPLATGAQIRIEGCDSCDWLTVVDEDLTAPPAPTLVFIKAEEAHVDDCTGEVARTLVLGVSHDAPSPEKRMNAFIFHGNDASSAKNSSSPRFVQPLTDDNTILAYRMSSFHNLEHTFCLAIELEDGAGNRSPRSTPLCMELGPTELPHEELDMSADMNADISVDMEGGMEPTELMEPLPPSTPDNSEEPTCTSTPYKPPTKDKAWSLFLAAGVLLRRRSNHRPT